LVNFIIISDICGYRRVYLILTLDDHSREILSGGFFNSDNVYNNMLVLRRVIEKYGLFKMLYTDNASLFNLSILDIKNGHIKFIEEK
jgi:hypothetical protein